jgi:hypothetical protein
MVDSTGSARRLQALAVMGYGSPFLAERLGVTDTRVRKLRQPFYPVIRTVQAQAIDALYRSLSMTPAVGLAADMVRARAAAGWAPALAWDEGAIDDPSAVPDYGPSVDPAVKEWEAVLDGQFPQESSRGRGPGPRGKRLREAAVVFLTESGWSALAIAEMLHSTARTVTRDREAARQAGWRFTHDEGVAPSSHDERAAHLAVITTPPHAEAPHSATQERHHAA